MSTQSLESMISCIFLAPGQAALEAENGYRKIWSAWLDSAVKRVGFDSSDPEETKKAKTELLKDQMSLAPVMKINGEIEIGLTMRIASVRENSGEVRLGTGPIGISGRYSRQTSEESVMSVRASFTLTNQEVDLSGFLKKNGIDPANPDDVVRAIKLLQPQ